MITERDMLRQMIEFSETPHAGPEEWCDSQGIEVEGLKKLIQQFAKTLWKDLAAMAADEDRDMEDGMEATVTTMLALFAISFELGRQYPSTPFEDLP